MLDVTAGKQYKLSDLNSFEARKTTISFTFLIRQRLQFDTVVNCVLLSLHGGSIKIKRAVL